MDDQATVAPHKPLSAEFWSSHSLEYEEVFGKDPGRVAAVHTWLSHLPPKSHVLDCGCGTGIPVAQTIADSGYHYYGIDMAAGMVELCQQRVPEASLEVANMLSYTPTRTFDGVVASLSFMELSYEEHVEMARKWFQWLRPGGLFLLCTITTEEPGNTDGGYGDNSHSSFDRAAGCASAVTAKFMGNEVLVTLFTQPGWVSLLEGAGFEIVSEKTDFVVLDDAPDEPRLYIIARKPEGN
ncbi:MAG: hypothetical protein L6R40_004735 [Gallowayella cf. fulva]|nr:MAG: hypothetical protein L6R40_004735 [Xanthomendoza cf. fulva]